MRITAIRQHAQADTSTHMHTDVRASTHDENAHTQAHIQTLAHSTVLPSCATRFRSDANPPSDTHSDAHSDVADADGTVRDRNSRPFR